VAATIGGAGSGSRQAFREYWSKRSPNGVHASELEPTHPNSARATFASSPLDGINFNEVPHSMSDVLKVRT
jgi:hypothetical protein